MYRTIIVDDELDIREGLQLLVDWKEYGFNVVGEAGNGALALDNMPIWRPDLIVTDILMPVLDGLEYIRRMKQQFPDTLVIVISAFGEFHYAKEALQLGVLDFLLKPISKQSLVRSLEKAKMLLDKNSRLRFRERVQNEFIQEKWLYDLCHGKLLNPEDLKCVSVMLQNQEPQHYQILLFEMDDYEAYVADNTESELDLKRFMIRNISEEIALKYGVPQVFEDSQERIGMLLRITPSVEREWDSLSQEIREALANYVKISVSIGVGKMYGHWKSIKKSYHEALQALEFMLLEGRGGIYHYYQISVVDNYEAPEGDGSYSIDTVLRAIDETEFSKINEELECFFDSIKQYAKTPVMVRGLCFELVMGMVRLVRDYNGDMSRVFGDQQEGYEHVFSKRSIQGMQQWITELSLRTGEYLGELRAAKLPDVMEEVKQLIEEHFTEDISLKMISSRVYKNPVYLGQLFKTTFGESFSQYVTRLRIEKAQELLRKDQLRVYEIAEKVGYVSLDTFYQRFRQFTGMNPTEYKQSVTSI